MNYDKKQVDEYIKVSRGEVKKSLLAFAIALIIFEPIIYFTFTDIEFRNMTMMLAVPITFQIAAYFIQKRALTPIKEELSKNVWMQDDKDLAKYTVRIFQLSDYMTIGILLVPTVCLFIHYFGTYRMIVWLIATFMVLYAVNGTRKITYKRILKIWKIR